MFKKSWILDLVSHYKFRPLSIMMPPTGCVTYHSASHGVVTSPDYPGRYPDLARCRAVIISPPGGTLYLQVRGAICTCGIGRGSPIALNTLNVYHLKDRHDYGTQSQQVSRRLNTK